MDVAWAKLWRSFVTHFGLSKAIQMSDSDIFLAANLCKPISESDLSSLMSRNDEARELVCNARNGMVPCVFKVKRLNGVVDFGVNFQPRSTFLRKQQKTASRVLPELKKILFTQEFHPYALRHKRRGSDAV